MDFLRLYFVLIVLTVGSYICTYILSKINKNDEILETQADNIAPTSNVLVEGQNPVANVVTNNMNTNQSVDTVPNPSMGVVSNGMPVNLQQTGSVSNETTNNNIGNL